MPLHDGYGLAVLHWSITGGAKPYTVTAGFGDGTTSGTNAQDAADGWYTALTATGRPCAAENMFIGWTFLGVSTEFEASGVILTGSHFASVVGTAVTGSPPSPLVAPYNPLVISKTTAFGGRKYRGRMFTPPLLLIENFVDPNGVVSSTSVSGAQSRWDAFFTDIATPTATRMTLNHSDVPAVAATPVTGLIVRNVLGSQRRRKARSS